MYEMVLWTRPAGIGCNRRQRIAFGFQVSEATASGGFRLTDYIQWDVPISAQACVPSNCDTKSTP